MRFFFPLAAAGGVDAHRVVLALLGAALALRLSAGALVSLAVVAWIAYYYGDFIYRSYLTLGRDLGGLLLIIRIKLDQNRRLRENRGIHEIFLDVVRQQPDRLCAIDIATGRRYTFVEFNALCNRFANYFQHRGYAEGDVVALFMENSVVFVAAWMGLAKIGVVTAWINSNLKMQPLAFCLHKSNVRAVITSETLYGTLAAARRAAPLDAPLIDAFVYALGEESGAEWRDDLTGDVPTDLRAEIARAGAGTLDSEPRPPHNVDFRSILCFIYTSGTTGMPKAALMKHFRYYSMAVGSAQSFNIDANARIYISMPLYHTSAGILGIGQVLLRGNSCAIRQKFSASNFWRDCVKYDCTVSQYIGEICRYLLAQPKTEDEARHRVTLMYGNGLRAEIWTEFVERFRVRIGEVYGSTEGTSNLVNTDGKVGSCGFLPISPLTSLFHPVRLVKVDDFTGEVLRRPDGLCYACRPGETGAMVSSIRPNNPLLIFEGYLNATETSKKVLHNVFKKGDSAFLTGDILHWDLLGYVYFKDRTGDTFRWKGENISTTEVESVLQPFKSAVDVTVYGVAIPGIEGKAGMAAIVKGGEESVSEFIEKITEILTKNLPLYAIPVFIRLCESVDRTGTFKLVKTNLQRLGFDRSANDELFIWDPRRKRYETFDDERRAIVKRGEAAKFL